MSCMGTMTCFVGDLIDILHDSLDFLLIIAFLLQLLNIVFSIQLPFEYDFKLTKILLFLPKYYHDLTISSCVLLIHFVYFLYNTQCTFYVNTNHNSTFTI